MLISPLLSNFVTNSYGESSRTHLVKDDESQSRTKEAQFKKELVRN